MANAMMFHRRKKTFHLTDMDVQSVTIYLFFLQLVEFQLMYKKTSTRRSQTFI